MNLIIVFVIACLMPPAEEEREWSSADGNYRIVAELVSFDGTTVKLRKKDGEVVSVDASRLSEKDQTFLADSSSKDDSSDSPKEVSREVRDGLSEIGLRYSRGALTLLGENELNKQLSASKGLMKSLQESAQGLNGIKAQENALKNQRDRLRILNVELNARLASVTSVSENNRLIGAINANNSQMDLMTSGLERLAAEAKQRRIAFNVLREEYIAFVIGLRKVANEIEDQITNAASNEDFQNAIKLIEEQTGNKVELETSRGFARAQKKLKDLEDTVLSETIPLQKDRGGTLRVTATFNGEKTLEMVLDSGASLILLTQQNADALGITVSESAQTIVMTVADGRQIQGKKIFLDSVRLGKFTVNDVECAVLDPNARFAEPLLGMSFLSNFKFEVDAQAETLTMVRISEEK